MKSGAFWVGILGGLIIAVVVALVLPFIGVFDMTATGSKNILDWWGGTNLESTIEKRAPKTTIPKTAKVDAGFKHYRATCLHCHGAPDAQREGWAKSMLPIPPELWHEEHQKSPEGELYYVISNGIRMSGMPAFGPEFSEGDIWNMVAMVKHLPQLSDQEKQQLQKTVAGYDHGGSN